MAIDTTIHRDADGRAMLTTEQAELVADYQAALASPGAAWSDERWTEWDALYSAICAAGEKPGPALARWVLRWAPVVQAAMSDPEMLDRAGASMGGRGVATTAALWAVADAVRAARGEGEGTP